MAELGRLVRIAPHTCWTGGTVEFARWLGNPEHIALLGDALGLELDVEAQPATAAVRADILCQDAAGSGRVVVELQLDRSEPAHLGQMLITAAALGATSAVWIADYISDTHRSTLDWLNQIANGRCHFYGLEIEVWQIADSPYAPRLRLISTPPGWSRTAPLAAPAAPQHNGAAALLQSNLSSAQQLHLDYWTTLKTVLESRTSPVLLNTPAPQSWCSFTNGSPGLHLFAALYSGERRIAAGVLLNGSEAKRLFRRLHDDKQALEEAIGVALDWRELPGKPQCHILFFKTTDPHDRRLWGMQHTWLAYALEALHNVFAPRLEQLIDPTSPAALATDSVPVPLLD